MISSSELQHLVGALRNHVANEKDAYNPVSRLTMKREHHSPAGRRGPWGIVLP